MKNNLVAIATDTVDIFDGLEQNLFNQIFEVTVKGYGPVKVDPNVVDGNVVKEAEVLGEEVIAQIAREKNFKFNNGLFPGYVGTDGLSLKYLLLGNVVLIFSLGEFQPARYQFYFEGAWENKVN